MVLENIFSKKVNYIYLNLILIVISFISIFLARLIFGANAGIVSVVFITLFLMLLSQKYISYKETLKFYFVVFFNIFFCYMFAAFILPQMGLNVFNFFQEQIGVTENLSGYAANILDSGILLNNFLVFIIVFLLGILGGNVLLFFLLWNASTWGSVFGYMSLNYAIASNINPFVILFSLLSVIIWHTFFEGASYILAGSSAKLLSQKFLEYKSFVFSLFISSLAFIILILSRFLLSSSGMFSVVLVSLLALFIFALPLIYSNKDKQSVKISFIIFVVGIILLLFSAYLESYVIQNSSLLQSMTL